MLGEIVYAIGNQTAILVSGPIAHTMAHGKPHDLRLPLRAEPHNGGLGFALNSLNERNHCIQLVNVVIELGFTGGEHLGETLGRSMVAYLDHLDGLVGTVTTAGHTRKVAPGRKRLVTMLFFPFGDKSGIGLCIPFRLCARSLPSHHHRLSYHHCI